MDDKKEHVIVFRDNNQIQSSYLEDLSKEDQEQFLRLALTYFDELIIKQIFLND